MLFYSPGNVNPHTNYICGIIIFLCEDICAVLLSYGSVFLHYIHGKLIFGLGLGVLLIRSLFALSPLSIRPANGCAQYRSLSLTVAHKLPCLLLIFPSIPHLEVIFSICTSFLENWSGEFASILHSVEN